MTYSRQAMRESEETSVIIIGGGPTGLSLALGLARHGVKSILLEKKPTISEHSKAPVVHQRTREIFDQGGIGDRFISCGNLKSYIDVRRAKNDSTLFSLDFQLLEDEAENPGILILKQSQTEKILLDAVKATGFCDVLFNTTAISVHEKKSVVEICAATEKGEYTLCGKYVVGCDGASGFVRDALGLSFPGKTYKVETVLADVLIKDKRNKKPWPRFYNGKNEITIAIKIAPEFWRLIHLKKNDNANGGQKEVHDTDIRQWVIQTLGEGPFEKVWASPFKIHKRASPRFRVGRILLAGDAAHIHSPVGGQGMNAGIQDAHNLAWKLAAVITGANEWRLLNSFETERKEAVVDKVSEYTDLMTLTFLQAPSRVRKASFFLLRKILSIPVLRKKFLRRTTMINLGYSNSEITDPKIPSAGMRLPNVKLITPHNGVIRLYDLLPSGLFILIIGNAVIENELPDNISSIKIGPGGYNDVSAKLEKLLKHKYGFILIRPDLHIAWTGKSNDQLIAAINKIT